MNLIKNAVEAGQAACGCARAATDGEAVVEVADDGRGCRAEARAHLFEPFFTTKPNGTGLGLPTSRRFVEAHGGTHRGATPRRWAARCSACGCPLDARDWPRRPPTRGRASMKPTVLVIDDEKTFRIVAEEALSAEGFDVTTASSGEAGLRGLAARAVPIW